MYPQTLYSRIILEYFYMEYFPFIGIDRQEEVEEGQEEYEEEKG
jgi:hypothetical protein